MNYGEVLSRAWQIIWKHKILWIFGILAGCGAQRGPNFNSNFNYQMNQRDFLPNTPPNLPPHVMRQLERLLSPENVILLIVGLIVLALIAALIGMFLRTFGRIGLVRGTAQAERGETPILGELFSGGLPYFWRSFWLWFLLGLPFVIIILAILAAFFGGIIVTASNSGDEAALLALFSTLPLFIGCICILALISFVVGLIAEQAQNAVVLEDLGVMAGLARGWDVFKANLGPIVVIAIILAVIGVVVEFVIALPVFLIVFPAMIALVTNTAFGGTPSFAPLILLMGVCFVIYIPISLVLNGILMSYTQSAWTLTYMQLTRPKEETPIVLPNA